MYTFLNILNQKIYNLNEKKLKLIIKYTFTDIYIYYIKSLH